MILTTIAFTGADDRTSIRELAAISKQHPNVEWGILSSRRALKYLSMPLLPGLGWVDRFLDTQTTRCLHLCGSLCRLFIAGRDDFVRAFGAERLQRFHRIQLNFHDEDEQSLDVPRVKQLLEQHGLDQLEIIVPVSPENVRAVYAMKAAGLKITVLFDESRGAGRSPAEWPRPLADIKCGYAGGLGPDNIREELGKISLVTPQHYSTWVDMQRRVRDGIDFDLNKIEACINESARFFQV